MKNKKLITSFLMMLLSAALLFTATYAWFYFPSSENLNIKTAPDVPIQTTLYHLVDDNGTKKFEKVSLDTNSSSSTYNSYSIDRDIVFFQWGGEYICESEEDEYYALVVKCEENPRDGYYKYILDALLSCEGETYIDDKNTADTADDEEKALRFRLVTLSYAFATNGSYNLSANGTAAKEIQDKSRYTSISFPDDTVDDITNDTYDLSTSISADLKTMIGSSASTEVYQTTVDGESIISFIVYLKVSADTTLINTDGYMPDIDVFGEKLEVNIKNIINIKSTLRTIPKKVE